METETLKRYAAEAVNKRAPLYDTKRTVFFVTRADGYKNAWQNARADCRFGRTVARVADDGNDGDEFELTPDYIVRSVETLEKRSRKPIEPTLTEFAEFCVANNVKLSKPVQTAMDDCRADLNARRENADASDDGASDDADNAADAA